MQVWSKSDSIKRHFTLDAETIFSTLSRLALHQGDSDTTHGIPPTTATNSASLAEIGK
jgi:hypothetical protein